MPASPEHKLTPALIRAMVAVDDDKVTQIFDGNGNHFKGPRGISSRCYRRLEAMHFIEDVPGQRPGGAGGRYFYQQLSAAGRAALVKAEAKDNPAVTQEVG